MQTESIRVSLRPRRGWEAVDLGFRMVRTWWRPLLASWLVVVAPVALVLNLAFRESLWLAALLVWWLKPLYDRIALFVLSGAVFGREPSVRETLRELPGLLRSSGLLGSLTFGRLSPLRSLLLPVLQLEGLRGRARRERARLLVGREVNIGVGLIFSCLLFELLVVGLGALSLLWMLLPENVDASPLSLLSGWVGGEPVWAAVLTNAVLAGAMSAIEPFYVAAGFSVYLNRRVYLEGWDIDLEFRRLARRAGRMAAGGAVGVLALSLLGAAQVLASECPDRPEAARDCVEQVLASPEFSTAGSVERWVPKSWGDVQIDTGSPPSHLASLAELLALVFQIGLWAAAAAAVVLLVRRLLRQARADPVEPASTPDSSAIALRSTPRPPPLPQDPAAEARRRFAAGDASGALSVLYRAALAWLCEERGLGLPASATEGECERFVRRRVEEELARDFASLTRAWEGCAYAARSPEPTAFDALCDRWQPRLEPT